MASPSVGELSPGIDCTDSKTFELLKQISQKLQAVFPVSFPDRGPLAGAAPLAARFRRRVRGEHLRRLDARLRRSSGPALSGLARDDQRPGAVGVEPRLVGRLSRAAILSAWRRLSRGTRRLAGARGHL